MKTRFFFACLIVCSFLSCSKTPTNNNDEPYAGEFAFEQRKLDMISEPPVAIEDTTISLKITCYPKYSGTGTMWVSLGAPACWVVLEYPNRDTLKTETNVTVNTKFLAGNSFTQEWRFKLLETFSGSYSFETFVRYDSIFIADSAKMYAINSPELKNIKWIQPSGLYESFTLPKP